MLRPLPLARLRVILFPRKPRLLPAVIHSIDKVLSQLDVKFGGTSLVWTLLLSDVLCYISIALAAENGT
jgi:hypothetical protein